MTPQKPAENQTRNLFPEPSSTSHRPGWLRRRSIFKRRHPPLMSKLHRYRDTTRDAA